MQGRPRAVRELFPVLEHRLSQVLEISKFPHPLPRRICKKQHSSRGLGSIVDTDWPLSLSVGGSEPRNNVDLKDSFNPSVARCLFQNESLW